MGLTVEGLSITGEMKDGSKNRIIRSLSFAVDEGERLAIVGRSGCGKTMTAMAILGLLPDNCEMTGSIRLDGAELNGQRPARRRALLGRDMVLLPQSGADFLNPSLTVRRQMAECLKRNGVRRAARQERMESLLGGLGFSEPERVLRSYPFQLSGGMAQRVVMAMASAGAPRLNRPRASTGRTSRCSSRASNGCSPARPCCSSRTISPSRRRATGCSCCGTGGRRNTGTRGTC